MINSLNSCAQLVGHLSLEEWPSSEGPGQISSAKNGESVDAAVRDPHPVCSCGCGRSDSEYIFHVLSENLGAGG